MPWNKRSENGMLVADFTMALGSAATVYTDPIDFIDLGANNEKYITAMAVPSATPGAVIDYDLYGSTSYNGTVQKLQDDVIPDSNAFTLATFNIKSKPAPYYKVAATTTTNESAKTVTITVIVP